MTTVTQQVPDQPQVRPVLYRLSVEEYHKMIAARILREGCHVHLIEGYLVEKPMQNPPHIQAWTKINRALLKHIPEGWLVRGNGAITLSDSEPEPDFTIARGPDERYDDTHPGAGDLVLVVEVADSTLAEDRTTMLRLYARSRIVQYWIVNIPERQVEVYTQPRAGRSPGYRRRQDYRETESIPLVLGGAIIATINVRDLLPSPPKSEA